jgi:hypothetical protein
LVRAAADAARRRWEMENGDSGCGFAQVRKMEYKDLKLFVFGAFLKTEDNAGAQVRRM